MNIDPDTMNRYQRKEAVDKPLVDIQTATFDDEGGFESETPEPPYQYNNPVHEEDEELLPGFWASDLTAWKQQYGDVYDITIKDVTFIIRSMQRFEYKEILSAPNTNPLIREEMICEYCVLYPQGYDFTKMASDKAGYPAILSEFIMDLSGFTKQVSVRKL